MLIILSKSDDTKYGLISGQEYTVGRKNCDILINNDASVSRTHALIKIEDDRATITDCGSKYRTFINSKPMQSKETLPLQTGDTIKFGVYESIYQFNVVNYATVISNIDSSLKKELKDDVQSIGGRIENHWSSDVTHLTVEEMWLTAKVLLALIDEKPIVTSKFWKKFRESVIKKKILPMEKNFKPPVGEILLNKYEISVNEVRKQLFAGKVFVFSSEKVKSRMEEIIRKAGGTCIAWKKDCLTLLDITSSIEKYIFIQEDENFSPSDSSLKTIYDHLSKLGLRTIPVQEVALAILLCSCEQNCNPKFNRAKHVFIKTELEPEESIPPLALETQITEVCPNLTPKTEFVIPETLETGITYITTQKASLSSNVKIEPWESSIHRNVLEINPFSKTNLEDTTKINNMSSSVEIEIDNNPFKRREMDGDVPHNTAKKARVEVFRKIDENSGSSKRKIEDPCPELPAKRPDIVNKSFNSKPSQSRPADNPFMAIMKKKTRILKEDPGILIKEISNHNNNNSKPNTSTTLNTTSISTSSKSSINVEGNESRASLKQTTISGSSGWISKNSCLSLPKPDIPDHLKDLADKFRDSVIVTVIPMIKRHDSSISLSNQSSAQGAPNFKKFKKVWPVKKQSRIINTFNVIYFNAGAVGTDQVHWNNEEREEEDIVPIHSNPLRKSNKARHYF